MKKIPRLENGRIDWIYAWKKLCFWMNLSISEIGQIKVILEFAGLAGIFLAVRKVNVSNLSLGLFAGFLFVSFVFGGVWLEKKKFPQKGNEIGNAVNQELMEILKIVKEIKEKL
jgi:hypothetical protein